MAKSVIEDCCELIRHRNNWLTTRGDESFQVLDVILLLLILLLLDDLVFPHSLGVRVKVSSVVCQLLLCQPDDVRAHSVQKILQAGLSYETFPQQAMQNHIPDARGLCQLSA